MKSTSGHIYRWLLLVYPKSFRERFGDTMCETFDDALHAARGEGLAAVGRVWISAGVHAGRFGASERIAEIKRRASVAKDASTTLRSLSADIRYGIRMLMKHRGLTLNAVAALALGIGLTTTMFSIVYGAIFRGLPFERPDELVHFESENLEAGRPQMAVSYHDYVDWRAQQTSFVDLGAFVEAVIHLKSPRGHAERSDGVFISHVSFSLLDARPLIGRLFSAEDDRPGTPNTILLSHAIWQRQFGSDSTIVGRTLQIHGEETTVIGVMPRGFGFPIAEQFWLPLRLDHNRVQRGGGRLDVFGRLKPGVTFEQAVVEFDGIAKRLELEYPVNAGVRATLKTFRDEYVGQDFMNTLGVMFIVAVLVLVVACANVANLLLARTSRRATEIAVRTAIGASRARIIRQLLTETLLIALIGAGAGLAMAHLAVDWFQSSLIEGGALRLPHGPVALFWWDFRIDAVPLTFVLILTLTTTLAAGLLPAIKTSSADIAGVLKDTSRGSSSYRVGRMTKALIISELAVTTGVLVAAGLTVKSVFQTMAVGTGLSTDQVMTARIGLPDRRMGLHDADYPDLHARFRFWDQLADRLADQPGVLSATVTTNLPVTGSRSAQIVVEGMNESEEDYPSVARVVVSANFFETFAVGMIQGRSFDERDQVGSDPVAIVNQSFADRFFPGTSPLFRQIKIRDPEDREPWLTIIGVAPDLWMDGPRNRDPEGIYLPFTQSLVGNPQARLGFWGLTFMDIAVRVRDDLIDAPSLFKSTVASIDGNVPVSSVRAMGDVIGQRLGSYRVFSTFFMVCGGAALLLALIGLYGVLAFSVSSRTAEIRIRMALGAGTSRVVRSVLTQGARHIGVGLGIGSLLALWLSRGLNQILYQVEPWDASVFAGVVALLVMTSLIACIVPARRAARIDPADAVRYD